MAPSRLVPGAEEEREETVEEKGPSPLLVLLLPLPLLLPSKLAWRALREVFGGGGDVCVCACVCACMFSGWW